MSESSSRTRVVAVVAERSPRLVAEAARDAAPHADLLEIRLDLLEGRPDPKAILCDLPLPVVATCRRPEDGGRWRGSEADRVALLASAGRAGAAWLDLEAGVAAPADRGGARILRSRHLPAGSGEVPRTALEDLEKEDGDLLKLVAPAGDAPEALSVLRLLRERPEGARPLAAFAAGEVGTATRLLQPVLGGALVYAAARRCRGPVPGMPTAADLARIYDLRRLRRGSRFFALLGNPLRHSVSPWTMNAALRAAGADAVFVPVLCADGEATARALLDLGAAGLAFTAPHKAVPLWLSNLSEAVASHSVAANTLFKQGTYWVAANTDGPAIRRLAREVLQNLEGKVVVVLGCGGAARSAAAALKEERCRVYLVGRNPDKTSAAAATVGARPGIPGERVDLLLNATPVGQWPGRHRDPAAELAPTVSAPVRFDAVYNPRETAFLQGPAEVRIRGIDMLVAQGVQQLRLFGIRNADAEPMLRAGERALEGMERRVLLVGMRGAGKTAAAEVLSRATGRILLDTDRMVEIRSGRAVYDIFRDDGEEAFRAMEREALERALRPTGSVVALGGGAVMHLDGPPSNSVVVWIRARPETLGARLKDSGRPSLLGRPPHEEVVDLLRIREPLYRRLADLVVDSDDLDPSEVAAAIASSLDL